MKLIYKIFIALVLFSPAIASAQTDTVKTISRDSIYAVVNRAEAGDADALNTLGCWYYNGEYLTRDYRTAARMWAKSAQLGNVTAIGNLGMCYQLGNGVEPDSLKAMNLYIRSLRKGNQPLFDSLKRLAGENRVFENCAMGYLYYQGIGCNKDYATSAGYYATAASKGSEISVRRAGMAYMNAKDYRNAFKWFKRGAQNNDNTSCYYYGKMLNEGLGTEANPELGFVYLLKAAENGMENAQYEVSKSYREGKGVTASPAMADQWLRKAAYGGVNKAIYDYALVAVGDNNFDEAAYMFSWLTARNSHQPQVAALFNPEDSTNIINTPFGRYAMILKNFENKDFKAVRNLLKELRKVDELYADVLENQFMLNSSYDKYDVAKAIKQLAKLAETTPRASYVLGEFFLRGNADFAPQLENATTYFNMTSEQGFPAQVWLTIGDLYYEGIYGERDYHKAVDCYEYALTNYSMMLHGAAERLATCYTEGQGCQINKAKAAELRSANYPKSLTEFTSIIK